MVYYGRLSDIINSNHKYKIIETKIAHTPDYVSMLRNTNSLKYGDIVYVGGYDNLPITKLVITS